MSENKIKMKIEWIKINECNEWIMNKTKRNEWN